MPDVYRAQVLLTGWVGGPGVNTLWFTKGDPLGQDQDTAEQIASELEVVYTALKPVFASGVSPEIIPVVDKLDEASGNLLARYGVDGWTIAGGSAASSLSRATQAKMRFLTDKIVGNRILQGGPFIGPINNTALTSSGGLDAPEVALMISAWGTFLSGPGPRLAVYSQPRTGTGTVGDVVSVAVKPLPAVLRSRRD